MSEFPSQSAITDVPLTDFDLSDFAQIEITGPDAKSFLHSFCTNDIKKLGPGQGCEAFIPDIKGRILGHVLAYVAENSILLIAVPGANDVIVPHLTKYLLGVDAHVIDRTGEWGLMCLTGWGAGDRLRFVFNTDEVPEGMHEHRTIAGGGLRICRADLTNLPTVLLSGSQWMIQTLLQDPVTHGPRDLFDALRIEAGFPWHGRDITPENIAQEAARTAQAISFTKGCYLGQEPIARLDAMGHTNKELRGLVIDSDLVIPDSPVVVNDKEVGHVTSAAFVPALGKTLALGVIRTLHATPGTELTVTSRIGPTRGVVYWPRFSPV